MRLVLAALTLALAPVALAGPAQAVEGSGYHQKMYQRYCDKLKEGPEAYAAFVKRMYTVTGYTYSDFAAIDPSVRLRAECRDANGALIGRAGSQLAARDTAR
jgi:hypothetical protein